MAEWPSGTVTFLFTDIEGSTQRWQQYPAAMGDALARHDRLLRDAISANGGVVFKTVGDAVCAAFATAPGAVAAALTAQRALYSEPWGITGPIRVRMALHTGQAEVQAGDYLGGPLNRVARLLSTGHGGQILLSGPTADLVDNYLPPGVSLRDLGTHKLKDVMRPEHIFQLVTPDLPADFAPLANAGPTPAEPYPPLDRPLQERRQRVWRPVAVAAVAVAVLAGAIGAMSTGWFGFGDTGRDEETPVVVAAETSPPTVTATVAPVETATAAPSATTNASSTIAAASSTAGGSAVARGAGQVFYTVYDGQPGAGHVFRVAARAGATPEDVSVALDALTPSAIDVWVAASPDGTQLVLGTERFDPECMGWPCLAVVAADLSAAELVRSEGAPVHPDGRGAVAGGVVVYRSGDGPHERDLWAIRRSSQGWGTPLLLTEASPYAHHAMPALAADGSRVIFECGDRPYGEAGTSLCEVGIDGSGFVVRLTPDDIAPDAPESAALRHPGYGPDGAIFFEASWEGTVWRHSPGADAAPVGPAFSSDGLPCVLSDGRIASLWLERPGNESLHELKVMTADGSTHEMLVTGVDIAQIGCGG